MGFVNARKPPLRTGSSVSELLSDINTRSIGSTIFCARNTLHGGNWV